MEGTMQSSLGAVLVLLVTAATPLPLVDPGLFVISGVASCGEGRGFCLLGSDCTMNQDFEPDPAGHCRGLKGAFTPSAHFVCCSAPQAANQLPPQDNRDNTSTAFGTTTESQTETVIGVHQTITSPPDYVPLDTDSSGDDSENSVDWEGAKNITEIPEACPPCSAQTVFSLDGSPLCLGTHLRHGWVLTSGSCALRVFRAGMIKVVGKFLQDSGQENSVKTIAVHEDYRPYSPNILHPEANNIGLILLSSEPAKACSPCIPDKEDKFAGKPCATTANSTALAIKITKQENMINDAVCEAIVETMQGEGTDVFYTVACDNNSDSRYNGEESAESGKGLMCRGYIAGIETSSGTGLSVFTRVSTYSDWITTNMMQSQRQSFDTGEGL